MARKITVERLYRHPRTRQLISRAKALTYMRRTGRRIRPEKWLYVRHSYNKAELAIAPYLKRRQGQIEHAVRLQTTEKILKASGLADRKIRQTFANKRVYEKLWKNWGGEIRITVGGSIEGKKVKEIIHLAYQQGNWAGNYEGFKEWLTGAVLSNLRRRGWRVSNPRESARRITMLGRNRAGMVQMLDFAKDDKAKAGLVERIKWATEAIRRQKKSKQIRGVTIKMEKLA